MVSAALPRGRGTPLMARAMFVPVLFFGCFATGNAAATLATGSQDALSRGSRPGGTVFESSNVRQGRQACQRRVRQTDFKEDNFHGGWMSSKNLTEFIACLYKLRTRFRPQKTIHVGGIHYPTLLTAHHTSPPVSTAASQWCWLDVRGVNGNGLTQRSCCDVKNGPRGSETCWDDYFTYELCCLGDVSEREMPHFFVAPAFDINVGSLVRRSGTFNLVQSYALQALCSPGDIVLDIGANVGSFTIPLAEIVGPRGEVHAFEPFRKVYQHLNANVALNGLTNVFTYNVALGSQQKVVEVHTPDLTRFNFLSAMRVDGQFDRADAMKKELLPYERKKERLKVRPLDTIEFVGRVSLVKIDVEFMELEVVRGGQEMFRRHRPVLWVENEPFYDNPQDLSLVTFLKEELNYVCRSIAHLELLCVYGKFDEAEGRLPTSFHRVFRHFSGEEPDSKLWQALHEIKASV